MKCDKCGYSDNGTGDWAHACGPVALQRAPVMNKRIRQLAEQAEIKFEAHLQHLGIDTAVITPADLEKFAELIVQECISINRQRMFSEYEGDSHRVAHNNALLCANSDMFEHFGVGE